MWKLVSMLLLAMVPPTALAQVQLTVPDVNGSAGTQVIVPVLLSEGQDITAIQFKIGLDELALTPAAESPILRGESLADHTIGWNLDAGQLSVVIFSGSLASLRPGAAMLIQLVLEVDSAVNEGDSTNLTLSEIQASDPKGSSVSVTGQGGTVWFSSEGNVPGTGENQLVFPQFANGVFPGGTFEVILIFVNRTRAASSGRVDLFQADGSPLQVSLKTGETGSTFPFDVPAGGSAFLQTDGLGTLSAGYATVSATGPLGGTLLFAMRDPTGAMLAEAGVGSSAVEKEYSIPVLYQPPAANTGIAFANVSAESVEIEPVLKDEAGNELDRMTLTLEQGKHTPQFADQYFPSLEGGGAFRGSIEVHASSEVSAIALKQEGLLLTTFPVVRIE